MPSWASFVGYVQQITQEDSEVLRAFIDLLTSAETDLRDQAHSQVLMLYEVLKTRRGLPADDG